MSAPIPTIQISSLTENMEKIQEGRAVIITPEQNRVFYNKVQVLNRDLSIAVISDFARERAREKMLLERKKKQDGNAQADEHIDASEIDKYLDATAELSGLKILEALAASGLRSIRYFQQIPGVRSILVNDLDATAVESIKRNIKFNNVPSNRVIASRADASDILYSHRKESEQFDVIDLDPYGSAAMLLDGAVQAISNGGLICVTCTDMPVLSGKNPETCYSRYSSIPGKAQYVHENAIRIVLQAIERCAIKYQRHIVPVTSCSIDFYIRVFVRVFKSPYHVKKSVTKLSHVFQCVGCETFHLQPLGVATGNTFHAARGPVVGTECGECGSKFRVTGPIWSDPLHDRETVLRVRAQVADSVASYPTKDRLYGLLTTISEEVIEAPLHYTISGLARTLHCTNPRLDQFQFAIRSQGYQVSQFHKAPDAIKTTAPPQTIWDIMRCWVMKHPINKKWENQNTPGNRILAKKSNLELDFNTRRPSKLQKEKVMRFPKNPQPYWGPKARAKGNRSNALDESVQEQKKHKVEVS
uniref:tRNA (guanine(26)-N(2))-dimethyltransferase n=1 Tax=Albugo laibachii Nc14 TaxID=890382 RepID=F0W5K3_9STRA|nr:N(2) putative [Albugo laibachii Nc14]|eukprot:CCA16394.1 N(2) putative [Albugo laibachii Nc14]